MVFPFRDWETSGLKLVFSMPFSSSLLMDPTEGGRYEAWTMLGRDGRARPFWCPRRCKALTFKDKHCDRWKTDEIWRLEVFKSMLRISQRKNQSVNPGTRQAAKTIRKLMHIAVQEQHLRGATCHPLPAGCTDTTTVARYPSSGGDGAWKEDPAATAAAGLAQKLDAIHLE